MSNIKPKSKIALNPIQGTLDLITGNNFSYESVPADKKLQIPENMQMAVFDGFIVDGTLDVDGTLILED